MQSDDSRFQIPDYRFQITQLLVVVLRSERFEAGDEDRDQFVAFAREHIPGRTTPGQCLHELEPDGGLAQFLQADPQLVRKVTS